MSLVNETDYGTPASKSEKTVTLTIDGMKVSRRPRALPSCARPPKPGT